MVFTGVCGVYCVTFVGVYCGGCVLWWVSLPVDCGGCVLCTVGVYCVTVCVWTVVGVTA